MGMGYPEEMMHCPYWLKLEDSKEIKDWMYQGSEEGLSPRRT
jgi:hypothetical protein